MQELCNRARFSVFPPTPSTDSRTYRPTIADAVHTLRKKKEQAFLRMDCETTRTRRGTTTSSRDCTSPGDAFSAEIRGFEENPRRRWGGVLCSSAQGRGESWPAQALCTRVGHAPRDDVVKIRCRILGRWFSCGFRNFVTV
jgi:hypothetical protein